MRRSATSPPDRDQTAASLPSAGEPRTLLCTKRMRLREFGFEDAQSLLELDCDSSVTRYLLDDQIDTPAKALLLIDHLKRQYADGRGLGIWHASDMRGRFLGFFSLVPVASRPGSVPPARGDSTKGRETSCDVEIGVRLHRHAWGKFFALEGGRALCAYAFASLSLPRLVAYCDPDNGVVPVLLGRLGFRATGKTRHFDKVALSFALDAP